MSIVQYFSRSIKVQLLHRFKITSGKNLSRSKQYGYNFWVQAASRYLTLLAIYLLRIPMKGKIKQIL